MSSHDTSLVEANQTSAGKYSTILNQTSDVLLSVARRLSLHPQNYTDFAHRISKFTLHLR